MNTTTNPEDTMPTSPAIHTRHDLAAALDQLKDPALNLDRLWSDLARSEGGDSAIKGYPEFMPSFDEATAEFCGMTAEVFDENTALKALHRQGLRGATLENTGGGCMVAAV